MEDFKIGYYYQYSLMRDETHHDNRLVVSYVDNHLEFKFINEDIWIRFYHRFDYGRFKFDFYKRFDYRNFRFNSLNYPVVYKEDVSGKVQELFFLQDIPIAKSPDTIEGFSISEPGKDPLSTVLYYDGKIVFENTNAKSFLELLFYRTVLHYFAVERKVEFYKREANPASLYYLQEEAKKIKKYLDDINFQSILFDLKVNVHDWHHVKLGDDDSYGIIRNVSSSHPLVSSDDYIKRVIGIGAEDIYSVTGFAPWNELKNEASDFLKEHPLGEYTGELLEKEKQRILSNYSREDHLIYLLSKRFVEKDDHRLELPDWEIAFQEISDTLTHKFHINELKRTNGIVWRKWCYNHDDAVKELDLINNYIKPFTTYSNS